MPALWNLYGKIKTINRTATTTNKAQVITYHYDGNGNRVGKTVQKYNAPNVNTWYVLDAQGNTMAVYEKTGGLYNDLGPAFLKEHHLYGSSRLGIIERNQNLDSLKTTPVGANDIGATYGYVYERGRKYYELTNHLGNVLLTVTDKRLGHNAGNGTYDYYEADVATAQDYYPFGMPMPGRTFSGLNGYRYGFNGKEEDDEVKGDGNQQNYGMRYSDPRLGRFLSTDPLSSDYPYYTPYQFAGNKPIVAADLDGLEEWMKSQELAIKQQVQIQMMSDRQNMMNVGTVMAYNPGDRTWTQKWRDSKNIIIRGTYDAVNGLWTLPQQLSSSLTGQKRINNIGGDTYDSKGIFGANQRMENGINGLTTLMPGAAIERRGASILEKQTAKLFQQIENGVTEQAPLLKELVSKGIAHTPAEILQIGRNSAGKVIFLEEGNAKAGLQHILINHAEDFAKVGISKSDIGNVVFEAATKGKQVGMQGTRPIYEVMYKGETKNIAVSVGNNGYIVGANPTTKIK